MICRAECECDGVGSQRDGRAWHGLGDGERSQGSERVAVGLVGGDQGFESAGFIFECGTCRPHYMSRNMTVGCTAVPSTSGRRVMQAAQQTKEVKADRGICQKTYLTLGNWAPHLRTASVVVLSSTGRRLP